MQTPLSRQEQFAAQGEIFPRNLPVPNSFAWLFPKQVAGLRIFFVPASRRPPWRSIKLTRIEHLDLAGQSDACAEPTQHAGDLVRRYPVILLEAAVMRLFVGLVLAVALLSSTATGQQDDPKAVALKEVRAAMGARDLPAIKAKLAAAAKLRGDVAYDTELNRLELLGGYVTQFWEAVDRAGRVMQAGEPRELQIGDTIGIFVEYENKTLILRVAGQQRTYPLQTMPAKVALLVAQQELDPKNANNKIFFGAFLLMDAKGDRKLAKQMWDEAAAGKVDVKFLLPEFNVEQPPPAVVLPALSPLVKAALAPKNWSLRTAGPKGWVKKPLGEAATQTDEGRLVVQTPTDGGDVQLVFGRQLTPNFVCRVYLEGVKKGQSIGLVSVDGDADAMTVELPSGTVVVELGRQAGQLKARIHGEEVELTAAEKGTARMPALFGITVPAGSQITVASFELGVP